MSECAHCKQLEAKLARAVEWAQEWKHEHSRRACSPNSDFDTVSHYQSKARAYGECEDYLRALAAGEGRAETRVQACGCVTCICEDEERCHGCGAKLCPSHTAALAAGKETK